MPRNHSPALPPSLPSAARAGIIADGAFKVLTAAVFAVGAAPLGDLLGVETWLMATCAVALLAGGACELGWLRRRSVSAYRPLMIAYDGGWALATLAGLLVAWRGGTAGGEVWIGYQAVAPLVFAALLVAAPSARAAEDTVGDLPKVTAGRR
ncbi:hypothetical protein AB0C52_19105 [Streptomyces sp. NPDC048717]|uniref:hypothetical protein n=1 Tax=Streptomyces sp. NPDC048717 TaxID=3154928 RepID=UPI0034375220